MKCPLFRLAQLLQKREVTWNDIDCLKEECAWWDGHGGFCAILKISRHLEGIDTDLERLSDKMPHEEQFRR